MFLEVCLHGLSCALQYEAAVPHLFHGTKTLTLKKYILNFYFGWSCAIWHNLVLLFQSGLSNFLHEKKSTERCDRPRQTHPEVWGFLVVNKICILQVFTGYDGKRSRKKNWNSENYSVNSGKLNPWGCQYVCKQKACVLSRKCHPFAICKIKHGCTIWRRTFKNVLTICKSIQDSE